MSVIEAIILGIIQGLTEFLPVSSSGHLELAKVIFGEDLESGESLLFTIVLHAATALSTIVIFRKDIAEIFKGLFPLKWNDESKFALKIIISMIPAALVGFFLESEINEFFNGNIVLVGSMLIITGLLLFLADKNMNTTRDVSFVKSLIIGISQAIAILPGISRSGATISTSVLLGVDRTKAARFSFLMVVPLILGAMTVKVKDYKDLRDFNMLSVQERTHDIMDNLEIGSLTTEEAQNLQKALHGKEIAWEKIKSSGIDVKQGMDQLRLSFQSTLERLELPEKIILQIQNEEYAGIRSIQQTSFINLLMGFIAAFLTGMLACNWMIALVKRSKLVYFSVYCVLVGIAAITWNFIA